MGKLGGGGKMGRLGGGGKARGLDGERTGGLGGGCGGSTQQVLLQTVAGSS